MSADEKTPAGPSESLASCHVREMLSSNALQLWPEVIGYLEGNNIVHRDLKCENLFLDRHDNLKIGDFGFARCLPEGESSRRFCGSKPSDDRKPPKEMVSRKRERRIHFPRSVAVNEDAKRLILHMLQPEPGQRPSTNEIIISDWLRPQK